MDKKKIVIVTGLSGSGKTTAINMLEDFGYYTVDNLPCEVGEHFLNTSLKKIALGMDIRSFEKVEDFIRFISKLKEDENIDFSMIFLEARREVLCNRYNLTRRRHPVEADTLYKSIEKEKIIMDRIKELSTGIINTSDTTAKQLVEKFKILLKNNTDIKDINIHIQSFGFKYGIPIDVDLVFDVRFLPNPYYLENLRNKTGLDKEVQDYVMNFEISEKFYTKLIDMLEFLVPLYIKEGKKHLSIGIGCSGGQHRSVTIAEKLYSDLKENKNYNVYIDHREKERNKWH